MSTLSSGNVVPFPNGDPEAMERFLRRCGKPAPLTGSPCVERGRHKGRHRTDMGMEWDDGA